MLEELLFPRRCPVCDHIVKPFGQLCCDACRSKLMYIGRDYCMKCGKGLREQEKAYCSNCLAHPKSFTRGRSLYRYECIAGGVFHLKYTGRAEYADFFGEEMYQHLGSFLSLTKAEALIPVPLHKKRLEERGYNQSALLAKALSKHCKIPCREDVVARIKHTVPQKNLNYIERQNNLKNAFKLYRNDVKLKRVIIIDDIYTTGSTLDALSKVLLEGGVKEVYTLTLAAGVE